MKRSRRHQPGSSDKQPLKDPSLTQTINFGIQVEKAFLLRTAPLTKEKIYGPLQKKSPR